MKKIIYLLFIFMLFPSFECNLDEDFKVRYLFSDHNIAYNAFKVGDYVTAAIFFEKLAKGPYPSPQIYYQLGLILINLGKSDEAESYLSEGIARMSPFWDKDWHGASHKLLGDICLEKNRLSEAREHYFIARRAKPGNKEIYRSLALLHELQGDIIDSKNYMKKALDLEAKELKLDKRLAELTEKK
jgi:tetratricopeptide (TPR) repeat protein